jgi:hypothetical protein
MPESDRGRQLLARIEARIVREADDSDYWTRHQRGEGSDEEAAGRLTARLRTVRLMIDGKEPTPSELRASLDELGFYGSPSIAS